MIIQKMSADGLIKNTSHGIQENQRTIAPCKMCNLIGRACVALGLKREWLLSKNLRLTLEGSRKCLNAILVLDHAEEMTQRLDLHFAAIEFRKVLERTTLASFAHDDLETWINKAIDFALLERKVRQIGYGCVSPQRWYIEKSIDVRWIANCIMQSLNLDLHAANKYVKNREVHFAILEMYDDIVDNEHYPLWRHKDISKIVPLGQHAWHLGKYLCLNYPHSQKIF